jgi:hypothetical protein
MEAERPANESSLFAGKALLVGAVSTRTRAPRGGMPAQRRRTKYPLPCAQAAVRVVSPDDCNGSTATQTFFKASSFAFRRRPALQR